MISRPEARTPPCKSASRRRSAAPPAQARSSSTCPRYEASLPQRACALTVASPAVEALNVGKSYGGVAALQAASFAALPGEVHALVGENGAGKSTLIKILGGRVRADTGLMHIDGQPVPLSGPQAAHDLGAWTVFQELTLLPWMTVAENLLLLREPKDKAGLIS